MVAMGALNPIEDARAALQEKIGLFLSGRAKLNRLMSNPSLTIQGEARGLYAVQVALETQLQNEISPKIQAVSSGVWSASDLLTLGGFTTQLIRQITNVANLEKKAGGSAVVESGIDMQTMMIGGVVLLGLSVFGGWMFGKR